MVKGIILLSRRDKGKFILAHGLMSSWVTWNSGTVKKKNDMWHFEDQKNKNLRLALNKGAFSLSDKTRYPVILRSKVFLFLFFSY